MQTLKIIEFPTETSTNDIFYACESCATHALSLRKDSHAYPARIAESNFSCELFYDGICEDNPEYNDSRALR